MPKRYVKLQLFLELLPMLKIIDEKQNVDHLETFNERPLEKLPPILKV